MALDGFDDEVDKKISYSERGIKNWVLLGILANVLVAIAGVVPIVFYLGSMQAQFTDALNRISESNIQLKAQAIWMKDREIWEAQIEATLRERGIDTPTRK